jgi:signal transduction histidine kinase
MLETVKKIEQCPRLFLVLGTLIFIAIVGVVDYLTGFEIFFSIFYLLGVGIATWYLGRGYGYFMSILSVAVWIIGDLAAGAKYSNSFIPIWNAFILLVFYFIFTWLLARLHTSGMELENRVRQRTVALTREMAECERLEKEILEVSKREQRRIGHDLHDGLCQHLTGTALAGQVLREKLDAKSLPEATDANKIVELVEDGITMARDLAHGLCPVEIEAGGLMTALQEFAGNISKWSKIICAFEYDSSVLVDDATTAAHLYRIAQEAVGNAIHHGKPKHILINLTQRDGLVVLSIEDDGIGLPEDWDKGPGLGTRIMAHRAMIIGSKLIIEPNPTGGTLVKCLLQATHIHRQQRI